MKQAFRVSGKHPQLSIGWWFYYGTLALCFPSRIQAETRKFCDVWVLVTAIGFSNTSELADVRRV